MDIPLVNIPYQSFDIGVGNTKNGQDYPYMTYMNHPGSSMVVRPTIRLPMSENQSKEGEMVKEDFDGIMEGLSETLSYVKNQNVKVGFEVALAALKRGKRITHSGWNGKGMFAYMVPAASYPVQTGAAKEYFGEGAAIPYRAYFALKTVDEDVAVWQPSISDILADDWEIL